MRYPLSAYFDHYADHSNDPYSTDDVTEIYTTEQGRKEYGCAGDWWCFTGPQPGPPNCGSGGGRIIGYDGHPAIDYDFPNGSLPDVVAAASGVTLRSEILGSAILVDHSNGYWTRYGHVKPNSRVQSYIQVERGAISCPGQ